jgi:predicted nucleic acid-binding protein
LSESRVPRGGTHLVLDTSVAVKFHVPEQDHEKARQLRSAVEALRECTELERS